MIIKTNVVLFDPTVEYRTLVSMFRNMIQAWGYDIQEESADTEVNVTLTTGGPLSQLKIVMLGDEGRLAQLTDEQRVAIFQAFPMAIMLDTCVALTSCYP